MACRGGGIGIILVDAQQVASGNVSKPPVVVCVSVKFAKIRSHSEVSPKARGCCNPEQALQQKAQPICDRWQV